MTSTPEQPWPPAEPDPNAPAQPYPGDGDQDGPEQDEGANGADRAQDS